MSEVFRGDDYRLADMSIAELQDELKKEEAAEEASKIMSKYKDHKYREMVSLAIAKQVLRQERPVAEKLFSDAE